MQSRAVSFEKGNVEDLKKKLLMLCNNETEVQSYRTMAADFICKRYNWDDVVGKTVEVYRK